MLMKIPGTSVRNWYLKATVEFALAREELGDPFRQYLCDLLGIMATASRRRRTGAGA